jgi:hypothetical protein
MIPSQFADQRAGDDDQHGPEQQVDKCSLAACFPAAGYRGGEEQAAPIHDRPIHTIGDWICTSRKKLNGSTFANAIP